MVATPSHVCCRISESLRPVSGVSYGDWRQLLPMSNSQRTGRPLTAVQCSGRKVLVRFQLGRDKTYSHTFLALSFKNKVCMMTTLHARAHTLGGVFVCTYRKGFCRSCYYWLFSVFIRHSLKNFFLLFQKKNDVQIFSTELWHHLQIQPV